MGSERARAECQKKSGEEWEGCIVFPRMRRVSCWSFSWEEGGSFLGVDFWGLFGLDVFGVRVMKGDSFEGILAWVMMDRMFK